MLTVDSEKNIYYKKYAIFNNNNNRLIIKLNIVLFLLLNCTTFKSIFLME